MVEAGSKKEQSANSDYWPMLLDYSESYCKNVLRSLELKAYAMVVTALRAQGPLTDAKQSSLKELRKLLSITIDRHKAEVRRAVNDEELATISDWICGYSVDEDWVLEGRRVVDVRPRPVPNTVYTDRANHIAERHSKANEHLMSPAQTGNLERIFLPPAPAPQQKSTARKQSHPRTVSSNANSSTPSITSAQATNQMMPIVSKPTAGTVVLNESASTQSNISQLEYSMMISENTSVNRCSHDTGVVIDSLTADIPQGDLIVDSFAEPIPNTANVKQGQSAMQPVIDAWSSEPTRAARSELQGQNIVLLGRPPFNQDSEHIIKVSGQQIQHLNPQITEVKSLQGIAPQQQQLRPPITQTRFLNASRVRPIAANVRPDAPQTQPSPVNQLDRAKFTVNASAGSSIRKTGSFIVVPSKGAGKTVVTTGSYQPVKILSSGPLQGTTHCGIAGIDKPITSRSFSAPVASKQQVSIQKQLSTNVPVDLDSDDITTTQSSTFCNTIRQIQPSIVTQSINSAGSLAYSVTNVPQQIIPKLTLSQLPQETQESFSVADKRPRSVEPPTNWIQMALVFLKRYCISWTEENEVAVLANDFTKVKQNLIGGMYPSIREMDADIRNIRLRSLGGARENRSLSKRIEDIFNQYDHDYRNMNERLNKMSGIQPKRPRYN